MSNVGGMDYDTAQMYRQAIFEMVCNADDWKAPIYATVPVTTPSMVSALHDAIIHFTGSVPRIRNTGNSLIVEAAGYRATIGA